MRSLFCNIAFKSSGMLPLKEGRGASKSIFGNRTKNFLEKASFSWFCFFCASKRIARGAGLALILLMLSSCNSDTAPDCLQNTGEIVRKEILVPDFTKITVFEKVSLILKQGDTQKVEIETGEFLLNEVSAKVEGDRLVLRNANGCNLFRDYGLTKIYITSPNITEIRSSTGFPIQSDGVLSFPNLTFLSESYIEPEAATTDGEFDFELDTQNLSVVVNGIAYFRLRGTTVNLSLVIASGDARIDAQHLSAQKVQLNHRGSNDMLIDPQQLIKGVIRGTGNVVSFYRPAIVEVEEIYKGRLIFME
ncbi:MAG: DUF2807 domain-containing protein [Maribacter sp.]|nr:DUF2807 domain-containing protein [Maribacter sp.]